MILFKKIKTPLFEPSTTTPVSTNYPIILFNKVTDKHEVLALDYNRELRPHQPFFGWDWMPLFQHFSSVR